MTIERGLEISITKEIDTSLIDPPTFNPREDFPDEEIAELADSIEAVGLLAPVIVRPSISDTDRFELVAGECRLRAVQLLGWPMLPAIIRDADDREVNEIRLIENLKRSALNAAETGKGLLQLVQLGHTPETLAELLRVSTEDIEARLRLADLPEYWQRWLRADDADHRRGPAAERLVPWIEFPPVLNAMQRVIDNHRWPMSLAAWNRELSEAMMTFSRSMDRECPTGPLFKITADVRERLQVREVRVAGELQDRAFCCELWDELQDAAVRKPSGKKNPTRNSAPRTVSPGESCNDPDASDDVPKVATMDVTALLQDDDGPDDADFLERLARWKDGWLRELIARRLTGIVDLAELERTAESLGVDQSASWETQRSFLEQANGRQLRELAELWQVDIAVCRDRGEAIAVLLHSRRLHSIPPIVLNLSEMVETSGV